MVMRTRFLAIAAAALGAASASQAADIAAGKAKAEPCVACHGENGISQLENVPSVAGQPDQFTQWQLVYFRSETRKNEVMTPLAAELTDIDIRNIGAYYASLPPAKEPPGADDQPRLTEEGAKAAKRFNCASCHKDDFAGQQAIARIAGQREDYLAKSLRDFKTNERTGGGVAAMPTAAYQLTDADITALAHYLSRLR